MKADDVYAILNKRIKNGGATDEQIKNAVNQFLIENPVQVGIKVSDTEPTEESIEVWINPNDEEEYQIPQINDDEESLVDTWSSSKINEKYIHLNSISNELQNGLKDTILDITPLRYNMYDESKSVVGTINTSGNVNTDSSSTYRVSDFIPVENGKTYGISYAHPEFGRYPLAPSRFCFFDMDKNFLEQTTQITTAKYTYFDFSYNPNNIGVAGIVAKANGYIRMQIGIMIEDVMFGEGLDKTYSALIKPVNEYTLKKDIIGKKNLDEEIKTDFVSFDDIKGMMKYLVNKSKQPYNLLNPSESILGTLSNTGNFIASNTSVYLVSKFIPVKHGDVYALTYLNMTFGTRYPLAPNRIVFYDDSKIFIEQIANTLVYDGVNFSTSRVVNSDSSGYFGITINADGYLRILYPFNLNNVQMAEGTITDYMDYYESPMKYCFKENVVEEINLSESVQKKLIIAETANISPIYTYAYCKLHHNVVFVGDSLTEGFRKNGDIRKEKSYPSYASKLMDCKYTNKGVSGITTSGWWNNYGKTFDFSTFDGMFIYLGTNGGLTDTINEDTSADNYEDYADTNTGRYCSIIEKAITDNPKIKIYIVKYGTTTVSNITQKIADKYKLPTIVVSDTSIFTLFDNKYHTDATHYNTVGYWALANVLLSQVEIYIKEHLNEYIDL